MQKELKFYKMQLNAFRKDLIPVQLNNASEFFKKWIRIFHDHQHTAEDICFTNPILNVLMYFVFEL